MLLAPQSHSEVTSLPSFPRLHFFLYSVLSYHQLFCLVHFLNSVTSILTMLFVFMIFLLFPRLLNQLFWTVCQDYYNSFLISVLTSNLLIFQSTIPITITFTFKKKRLQLTISLIKCLNSLLLHRKWNTNCTAWHLKLFLFRSPKTFQSLTTTS